MNSSRRTRLASYILLSLISIASVALLVSQQRTITDLKIKTTRVEHALAAGQAAKEQEKKTGKPATSDSNPAKEAAAAFDQKAFLEALANPQYLSPDIWKQFQSALSTMKHDELLALLDVMIGAEISTNAKAFSIERICSYLYRTNKENTQWLFTVTAITEPAIRKRVMECSALHFVFKDWATRDYAAASSWLDQLIQGGIFSETSLEQFNRGRIGFEKELVSMTWSTDPDRAAHRLKSMSEGEVLGVLFFIQPIPEENWGVHAKLARECLSPKHSTMEFCNRIKSVKSYADKTKYLDAISATSEEREAIVMSVAEEVAGNNLFSSFGMPGPEVAQMIQTVDELRAWGGGQSARIDQAIGCALAGRLGFMKDEDFDRAAALLLHLQETSGSDEMIRMFLSVPRIQQFRPKAIDLANQIKDPEIKASAIEKLTH